MIHLPAAVTGLLFATALLIAPGAMAASTGAAAVDSLVAACGGRDAIVAAHAVRRSGTFSATPDGDYRLEVVTMGTVTDITVQGEPKVAYRAENGFAFLLEEDGSRIEPMTPAALFLPALQGTAASLPWILLEGREVAEASPSHTPEGTAVVEITLPLDPRMTLRVTVDAATGLAASLSLVTPSEYEPMRAVFSDYRDVGGLLLPFREEYSIDAHRAGSFSVTEAALSRAPAPGPSDRSEGRP